MKTHLTLSTIEVDELETLIQNSVERALKAYNLNDNKSAAANGCFLNIHEAAALLNLSVPTVYCKVSKGELPVMKRGKKLYFSREELTMYLKAGRKATNSEIQENATNYLKK